MWITEFQIETHTTHVDKSLIKFEAGSLKNVLRLLVMLKIWR